MNMEITTLLVNNFSGTQRVVSESGSLTTPTIEENKIFHSQLVVHPSPVDHEWACFKLTLFPIEQGVVTTCLYDRISHKLNPKEDIK
jgi:hypothetical protein